MGCSKWRIAQSAILVGGLLVTLVGTAWGSGWYEAVGSGVIDWETATIRVSGYGAPPPGVSGPQAKLLSQRAAKVDAYRNALEIVEGVRVRSETSVSNYVVQSDQIKTSVEGMVNGAQFESVNCDLSNTCEAVLVLPLDGKNGLTQLLGTTVRQQTEVYTTATGISTGVAISIVESTPVAQPEPQVVTLSDNPALGTYTGIIIDASGMGIQPAMYPQVFDTQGKLIYGPGNLNPDIMGTSTMAAYARSVAKAKELARVGANPLVVKATSAVKVNSGKITDVALDSVTADTVRSADKNGALFTKAAVAIVID